MPSANVLAHLPQCQAVAAAIIADSSFSLVMKYLNAPIADPSNINYNEASINYAAARDFFLTVKNPQTNSPYLADTNSWGKDGSNNGLKFLLTLDDGTVIVDTGKSYTDNTIVKFKGKSINENHNTRPEVLQATLTSSGVGTARRYSSTSGDLFQYYAVRLGNTPSDNIGTLRIAYDTVLN